MHQLKKKNALLNDMYKIKKIKNFKFKFDKVSKSKFATIVYRKVHSNYFLTLVDKRFRVIVCVTSGNSGVGNTVRKKVSAYAMEKLGEKICKFLNLYKIRRVVFFFRSRPSGAIFVLSHQLTLKRIKVIRCIERIRSPHNGIRGRKLRRK